MLKKAELQLNNYFQGKRKEFDLPLQPSGTEFQQSVWHKLAALPYGVTVTYGEIATALRKPSASRAVGADVGKNPICLFIPCHRVLGSKGKLGGFVDGVHINEMLLNLEKI